MNFLPTKLPGVTIIEPKVFRDERGAFMEFYHCEKFRDNGIDVSFVQDNYSQSVANVLRGLHYQVKHPQGKLIRVVQGEVFDVTVDVRIGSPNYLQWIGVKLSCENCRILYIPPGYAHGFCVLSPNGASFEYKCTDVYHPEYDRTLKWDDPDIGVEWPISNPILSTKDINAPNLADAELPVYNSVL